jgi:hypothetical protein
MARINPPSSVSSASPGHSISNENPPAAPGTWRASLPDSLVHDLIAPVANGDFAAWGILSAKGFPKGGESLSLSPQRDSPLSTFFGAAGASGSSSPSAGTGGTRAANSVLVLPSAGTTSQGQAGSETLQTAGFTHPLIAIPSISVGNGGYVPVNADDDNGSALTNGIPAKRDFDVQPMTVADPELIQATVSYPPGTITAVSLVFTGNGKAALWTDQKKTAPYTVPTPPVSSTSFYVEGTRPSSALWDVSLKVSYVNSAPGSNPVTFTTPAITVTPVVNSFTVTPHAAPSVVFWTGVNGNGLSGLFTSGQGDAKPGAAFDAQVTRTNTGGTGYFIQTFVGVDNGAGGAAAGWVFTAASGLPNLNSLLSPGDTFPILDNAPRPPNPFYPLDWSTAGSDANTLKMYADDSPSTLRPVNSDKLQNIDVTYRITLYVVWQFADNSIYTLASDNWKVVFQADTNVAGSGVTHILDASGVSSEAFVLTNADVPAQALKAPVFNTSYTIR